MMVMMMMMMMYFTFWAIESNGSYVVNRPSFLPAVMTSSSSSVGVVMSCHVSEASLLSS